MQHDVIYGLTEWIESQLASKLSLDTVAAKSGYSKWYLQRVYHELTGVTLSRYIRQRRLSAAAAELHITRTHILDIALKYGFTTQQAFTRSFRDYFHQTPARYRNNNEWDCSQLYPPYKRIKYPLSEPDIIRMPEQYLIGMQHSFPCSGIFEGLNKFDIDVRMNFFKRHFRYHPELPSYICGLSHFESGGIGIPGGMIKFSTAIPKEYMVKFTGGDKLKEIIIPEGNYVQFNYLGTKADFQQFIVDVNCYHLPKLGIIRRKGYDIERYFISDRKIHSLQSNFISCNYLVPCCDALHKPVDNRFM